MAKFTEEEKREIIERGLKEGEVDIQIQAMIGSIVTLCEERGLFTSSEFLEALEQAVPYYERVFTKQLKKDIEEYEVDSIMKEEGPNGGILH